MTLFKTIMTLGRTSRRDWSDDDDELERKDLVNEKTNPENGRMGINCEPPSFETRYRDLERTCRNLRRGTLILGILSACVVVLLLFPWGKGGQSTPGESQASDVDSIPIGAVTFNRDERFAGAGEGNDVAWGEMMPPGDGFVRIENPPTSIPPGIGSKGEIYDISLFHQLHCLSRIRTYLYTMQASLNQSLPYETFKILLAPQEDHVEHCFDYLRQGLMCAGDMTLEWPRIEEDGRRFAVDGWGVEHQCKSWVSDELIIA
ncbi:hypothetical protein AC579_3717 [Pseudocercospora musae]|uniref:Tat pathway signal sequence n=1 Tax=Pseudocercospora musae TaxID=113226 RepID=A0A139IIQ8_9PEZI|nr:hypothetical protein AC579_3717 [Pseudocercospora musae]